MKRIWFAVGYGLSCICFAIVLVRSWIRESSGGHYFMTVLWAGPFLMFLFAFLMSLRSKE